MKFFLLTLTLISVVCIKGFAQIPSYVPSNGLVGWWPFNGNVNDQSGNGHNGTTYGSWNYTSDRFGNANAAFNFNTAARVETNATGMFTRQKISISVWVYSLDTVSRSWITKSNWSNAQNEMFGTGQLGTHFDWSLKYNSSCAPSAGWHYHQPVLSNYVNTWKHYVFVCDSLKTTIYINGVQQTSFINVNGIDICNGGQLRFGAWWQNDTKYFKGKLDDIGIWNRVLTPQEVTNLYNASNPNPCVPPVVTVNNASICQGGATTLTAQGANTYVWSPITGLNTNVGANVIAAPTITTTYAVTGTNAAGCSATATAVVTVSAGLPSYISPIQGPSTVQVGGSIQLTDSTQGGIWSVSNSYFANVSASGVVSGVNPGIDTVWYSYANSCGQISSFKVIQVLTNANSNTNCGLTSFVCPNISSYQVGNNSGSASNNLPTPFRGYYTESKCQMLVLASELHAAGLQAGTISEIGWNVLAKNSSVPTQAGCNGQGQYAGFTISLACVPYNQIYSTSSPVLDIATPKTVVYSTSSYNSILGMNSFPLQSSYSWDGVSNILVQTCFDAGSTCFSNDDRVSKSSNANISSSVGSPTTLNLCSFRYSDTYNACDSAYGATGAFSPSSVTERPDIYFKGCNNNSNSSTLCGFNDSIYATRPTTFCQGDSTVLHAVATGANFTYAWYNQNGNLYTPWSNTGAYQSGNYYAVISNGICTDTSNIITVTVNQSNIPNFTLTSTNGTLLCSNDSTVLNTHLSPLYNYTWKLNGNIITTAGIHDSSIVVHQQGNYSVTVNNGGCPRTGSIYINVSSANINANLSLIYGTNTICLPTDSATLQVMPNYGYNYTWYYNGTQVANHNWSTWYSTRQTGTYKVIVSAGSCVDTTNVYTINACNSGGGSGSSTCSNHNLDFNDKHWTNWQGFLGSNTGGFQLPMDSIVSMIDSVSGNPRHLIVSSFSLDPYTGLAKRCPWGGVASIRLGNDNTGKQSESVKYNLQVTDSIFSYSFALVFNDGGHALNDQAFFKVHIRNNAGVLIPALCDSFSPSVSNLIYLVSTSNSQIKYSSWQTKNINFSAFLNQSLSVEFITSDCSLGGHFGYAYLDADCLGNVTTNLNLNVTGNSTWCGNDSCTITAPQCSGNYQWYRNGVLIATTSTNTLVVKQSGSYYVVYTNSSCFGSTDTVIITANSNPNVIINPVNLNYINYYASPVQLSGTPGGGTLSGVGLNASSVFSPSVAGMGIKNIYYSYTDSNGCSSSTSKTILVYDTIKCSVTDTTHYYDTLYTTVTDTLKFQVSLTGVNPPANLHQISVYPNPAHDYLMINFGTNWNVMLNYQFQVHNVAGQLVESGNVTQQMHTCNLNNWTGAGTYTLTIRDLNGQLKAKKIIVLQ